MAKRADITLIYLGAQRTDRADFGPAPEFALLSQAHLSASAHDDPVTRLDTALLTAPRPGKAVWILWEGASVQFLDMPSGVVEGLDREQLADSLSFEAEPLTSIPSADSAIDGIPDNNGESALPDFRRFWITQMPASLRERMKAVAQKAGAKFGGVAHPGGLPREKWADAAAASEWRRVEIWDQLTFTLQGGANGSIRKRLIRAAAGTEQWSAELPTAGPISWLSTKASADEPAHFSPDGLPLEIVRLDFPSEAAPVDWLRGWAAELSTKTRRVPAVQSLARLSPLRKFWIAGGVAAAIVFLACSVHGGWLYIQAETAKVRADNLEATRAQMIPKDNSAAEETKLVAEAEKLQPRVQDLTARESALNTELERIEKAAAELTSKHTRLNKLRALHRPAVGELLAALSDAERNGNSGEIVVKEVRQDGSGALKLTGLCRPSSQADSFATRLDARLAKAGWKVGAAQKVLRDDRLAFDFTLVLTPAVLLDQPLAAPPKPVTFNARDQATKGDRR